MGDRKKLLDELNEIIKQKETEESEAKAANKRANRPKSTPDTRAEASRANGANSQGPTTPEGKQRASANSLKHGFFANVEKLNPQDAPIYQQLVYELRLGLHPETTVEEMLIRELAMLSARLKRLEPAEYALLCANIEAPDPTTEPKEKSLNSDQAEAGQTIDSRAMAAAFLNTQDNLDRLHKIEVHLRRAYSRTWDRLRSIQKERRRISPEEWRKRTHHWVSEENERTSASSQGKSSPNPLDDSRDFDDDFPPLPTIPSPTGPPIDSESPPMEPPSDRI